MEHPHSQSTPRKVKPLKSKDEFSSLHKRIRPLKEPLPIPIAQRISRKPRVHGSDRIFSTMGTGPDRKHRKVSYTSLDRKEYQCLVDRRISRVALNPKTRELKFDLEKGKRFREFSLTYSISEDRKSYIYSIVKEGSILLKFDLGSDAHIPFKNDCSDLKISLCNVGPNVPPLSKRIEPLEPFTKINRPDLELVVKLIETSPPADPNLIGRLVDLTLNERGIYFTSSLLKFFRWSETTMTKKGDDSEKSTLVMITSNQMSVLIDALSEETSNQLHHELERRKRIPNESPKRDEIQSPKLHSTAFDGSTAPDEERPTYKALDPAQFYSPQAKISSGSREPAAASSPRQSHLAKISSSPSRSVESIHRLCSPPVGENQTSPKDRSQLANDAVISKTNSSFEEQLDLKKDEKEFQPTDSQPTDSRPSVLQKSSEPPRRQRRRTRKVPLEDDVDSQIEATEEDFSQLRSEGFKPVLYKFWDGKSMKLAIEDIARLNPQIYINDTIIWFFLRLSMEKLVQSRPNIADDILLLDTFYYFSMRNGDTPPSWVLKIRFDTKGIVVMPIHESSHWSLAIIVDLDKRLQGQLVPVKIVVLDSLGPAHIHHTARKVGTVLTKSFRSQNLDTSLLQKIQAVRVDIPTQTNTTDCGVYLLHYIARIFANIDTFRSKVSATTDRTLELGADFWDAESVTRKRSDLKQQLKDMGNVDEIIEGSSELKELQSVGSETASTGSGSAEGSEQDDLEHGGPKGAVEEEDEGEEDDDAIEVIGMESLTHKKRGSLPGSALHSRSGCQYLGPPPGRPGRKSNAIDDIFKSPK